LKLKLSLMSWALASRVPSGGRPNRSSVPVELVDLPIELDYRTEMILRKAYLLAND
jgi:hypothetical protein